MQSAIFNAKIQAMSSKFYAAVPAADAVTITTKAQLQQQINTLNVLADVAFAQELLNGTGVFVLLFELFAASLHALDRESLLTTHSTSCFTAAVLSLPSDSGSSSSLSSSSSSSSLPAHPLDQTYTKLGARLSVVDKTSTTFKAVQQALKATGVPAVGKG